VKLEIGHYLYPTLKEGAPTASREEVLDELLKDDKTPEDL
jgi:hypothetical protein